MTSTQRASVPPIVWSLTAPFMVLTLGIGLQVGTPDPSPPTALEQALIDHICTAKRAGTPGSDPYQECLSAQLLGLRADVGRDLGRLSAAERKTIDSVCSKVSAARGRDAYLSCLSGQLVSWRDRWNRAHPAPSQGTPIPSPSVSPAPDGPAPPARQMRSWSSGVWIGAALVTVIVAAGGVFLAVKGRRAPRKCRVCGMDVSNPGDLCQKCRHEAAEAMRHAAAERANHLRAQEEEPRRQREREEEQRRQSARQEEDARVRQQEQARQREEEARQREEESDQRRQADVASEEVFDPYAVLGVPRDASKEDIQTAYQQAKSKYDPDQVGYLSAELQEHFKAKAQAVDRAYRMLTE